MRRFGNTRGVVLEETDSAYEATGTVSVGTGSEELLNLTTLIALGTGGTALGPIDELPAHLKLDPPRIVRVDRRTDIELWSRPGLLFLIVGLLGLEWLLRQRSGYL